MGSWDNATYLECARTEVLVGALSELLDPFGYALNESPSYAEVARLLAENVYDEVLRPDHFLVGVQRMNPGWVKIHCHPHYLLCAAAEGDMLLRLLCEKLGASALHVNIYDGCSAASVSVVPGEEPVFSGMTYDGPDYLYEAFPESAEAFFAADGENEEIPGGVELPFHGALRKFSSFSPLFKAPPVFAAARTDFPGEGFIESIDEAVFPENTEGAPPFAWEKEDLERFDLFMRFSRGL